MNKYTLYIYNERQKVMSEISIGLKSIFEFAIMKFQNKSDLSTLSAHSIQFVLFQN